MINVWYALAIMGVCMDHYRQVKTKMLCCNVNKLLMGKIFRSPRLHAEYSDIKSSSQPKASSKFQVNGYGQLGNAKFTGLDDPLTGEMRVKGDNASELYLSHVSDSFI